MISTRNLFALKSTELDLYYEFLAKSQRESAYIQTSRRPLRNAYVLDADLQAILKANFFLLLYNMIESVMKSAISEIYSVIINEGLPYSGLKDSVRELWIKKSIRDMKEASPNTYQDVVRDMIDHALRNSVMALDQEHTPISGNLDARKIREICDVFGISHTVARRARGGNKLLTVKNERNALAHGDKSFVECGRDYTVEDLKEIKNQTIWYMAGIIRNVSLYILTQKYKSV